MIAAVKIESSACQVCDKKALGLIENYGVLPRITSDCRPFHAGGKLAVCMNCAAVQKISDAIWLDEINQIYLDYQAYRIADGEEQLVMDPTSGMPKRRSSVLMEKLGKQCDFPVSARVLDIGCGDGVTLKAMTELFPNWILFGHELGTEKLEKLEKIPGFKKLFIGDLAAIDQSFDMVTMIHSLEHFVNPLNTLKQLRSKVSSNGKLFVEVCNIDENPFDLLVADHLMHFSPQSLSMLTGRAGFSCLTTQTNWVKKEISFVGQAMDVINPQQVNNAQSVFEKIQTYISWLTTLVNEARKAAAHQPSFGIFGTSIAASWLANALSDQVKFFVDEDPNRIGRQYMAKPIYAPEDVPPSSSVYLALAPALSNKIAERLKDHTWSLVKAPAL